MHTTEMSAVQQRTIKLQKIISETSLDKVKVDTALAQQLYDIQSRLVPFSTVLSHRAHNASRRSTIPHSCATTQSQTDMSSATSRNTQQRTRRTLVIFVRHFLCGLCQEYLQRLRTHPLLSEEFLAKHNVNVAIVGCGSPSHIASYRTLTKLPDQWPLFADPSTDLYNVLGMRRSLKMGDRRPTYLQRTLTGNMLRSIVQGVKRVPKGDVGKAGAWDVNGGEFLFESSVGSDDWTLRWCHQMENSRDHTEIEDLIGVLGLNSTPSSPTPPGLFDNPSRLHARTQSTPLILISDPLLMDKLKAQEVLSKQHGLRRTFSLRRHGRLDRLK